MHAAQVDLHCGWLEEILVGREEGARCFEEVRRLPTQDVCLLAHGHKALHAHEERAGQCQA